ncbi:Upstream activation factor subunit UAF30 [Linum grandiflorum]
MSFAARVFRTSRPLLAPAKSSAAAPTGAKVPAKKPKRASPKPKSDAAPKKTSGILKQVTVSPELGSFLGGVPEASRTDAVKKIWSHIKEHQLQNPLNKKEIICDDKLKTIFAQKERVGMLEIAKLLSPHFEKSG